jgi:hypothetical protein
MPSCRFFFEKRGWIVLKILCGAGEAGKLMEQGQFTPEGKERSDTRELYARSTLSECKTRSLVKRVRIVNLHYLFPASEPK